MEKPKREHFVTYLSPGTFVSEETTKPIESWDTRQAAAMAKSIVERYEAKPYGLRFSTRLVAADIPDGEGGVLHVEPKVVAQSGIYFIDGTLRTYDEVLADNKQDEQILASNMRCNGWWVVCETRNSYRSIHPFEENDCIVDADGNVTDRGDSPHHVKYRALKNLEHKRG